MGNKFVSKPIRLVGEGENYRTGTMLGNDEKRTKDLESSILRAVELDMKSEGIDIDELRDDKKW